MAGREILTMLHFYNFLTLLSEYRQAITQYQSETISMMYSSITDLSLCVNLTILEKISSNAENKIYVIISVNDDGDVKAEISNGTYSARMLSLIEYSTLIMSNLVNDMLRSIEEAKAEVLNNE